MDETSGVHGEMWDIRSRHEGGSSTVEDWRRYRACWQALALRRSVARRAFLPPVVDDLLAERRQVIREIQVERAWQAVEAVFAGSSEVGTLPA